MRVPGEIRSRNLVEIGAGDIPMITAFNKIDLLKDTASAINVPLEGFPTFINVSYDRWGLEKLLVA